MKSMILSVAVLLAGAGCTNNGDPIAAGPEVSVGLVTELVATDSPRETIVVGGNGSIMVEGSVLTGTQGYQLEASLEDSEELELVVTAERHTGVTVPAHYRFNATISGLAPGEHDLTVYRRVIDGDQDETVAIYEATVTVD